MFCVCLSPIFILCGAVAIPSMFVMFHKPPKHLLWPASPLGSLSISKELDYTPCVLTTTVESHYYPTAFLSTSLFTVISLLSFPLPRMVRVGLYSYLSHYNVVFSIPLLQCCAGFFFLSCWVAFFPSHFISASKTTHLFCINLCCFNGGTSHDHHITVWIRMDALSHTAI